MVEGGFDFVNPEFDPEFDDYDDIDDRLVPDDDVQRVNQNQSDQISCLRGRLRESAIQSQEKQLQKAFYNEKGKRYKMVPGKLDYDQFRLSDVGKTLYWVVGDKEIRVTAKQGQAIFLSLGSLANEYNRAVGKGGARAIREYLNLPEYQSKTITQRAAEREQARKVLESTRNDLLNVEEQIPLEELSCANDLKNLSTLISGVDEDVSLETAFVDYFGLPDIANTGTQTEGLTFLELEGLDKSLQGIRRELTNNLAKLTDIDNQIEKKNDN